MHDLDRRRFLQGAAATAAGLALAPLASWASNCMPTSIFSGSAKSLLATLKIISSSSSP